MQRPLGGSVGSQAVGPVRSGSGWRTAALTGACAWCDSPAPAATRGRTSPRGSRTGSAAPRQRSIFGLLRIDAELARHRTFPPGGRWWALGVGRLGRVEDGFDLYEDLDAVADDHPTAVQGDVGADAEVAPVELGGGREAGPGAAVGVAGEAVDVQGQGDRPGHPVQGQLAADVEAVLAVADAGGAVGHRRVGVGLEEVG